MRINLVTPFAEKDAAKALGARWDATRKIWYIMDVADLTPFLRWIPNVEAATADATDGPTRPVKTSTKAPTTTQSNGHTTKSIRVIPHCGCKALPWDDCEHTA